MALQSLPSLLEQLL